MNGKITHVSILPRPANGGRTCMGATYQFQMCNTNECEDIYNDPREEQCRTWDPDFELHSNKHHWLPYEHPDCECAHPPRAIGAYKCVNTRLPHVVGFHVSLAVCYGHSHLAVLRTTPSLDYTLT